MSTSRAPRVIVPVAATCAALLACYSDPIGPPRPFVVDATPVRLTLSAGAEADVLARILDGRAGTVRWASLRPDLVRLDTTVAAGTPARVRGLRAGSAVVVATTVLGRDTIPVAVPVEVTP